jgi:hypothetical protein
MTSVSWQGLTQVPKNENTTRIPSASQRAIDSHYSKGFRKISRFEESMSRTKRGAKQYLKTIKICILIQAWWRGYSGRSTAIAQRHQLDELSTWHRGKSQRERLNISTKSIHLALVDRHHELVETFQTPGVHNPNPLKYTGEWWFPRLSAMPNQTLRVAERNKNFILREVRVYERTGPDGFYALLFQVFPTRQRENKTRHLHGSGTIDQPASRVLGVAELETLLAPLFRYSGPPFEYPQSHNKLTPGMWWESITDDHLIRHVTDDSGERVNEWARRGGRLRRRELVEWLLRRMFLRNPKSGSTSSVLSVATAGSRTGSFASMQSHCRSNRD